jgi:hypothetical protein
LSENIVVGTGRPFKYSMGAPYLGLSRIHVNQGY